MTDAATKTPLTERIKISFGEYTITPDYTKFDYAKEKNIEEKNITKMHTCTIDKRALFPVIKDQLCGLQLDMNQNKNVVVTGMKFLSPFNNTQLRTGWTILGIQGITDFESAEQAEEIIKASTGKVSIVAAKMENGQFVEFVGKDKF